MLLRGMVIFLGLFCFVPATASFAAVVEVTAFADPWLAGQTVVPPFGTTGTPWNGGPGSLPVAISVAGQKTITLTATGLMDWAGSGCCLYIPPAGLPAGSWPDAVSVTSPFTTISGFNGPELSLVGVFDAGSPWEVFYIGSGGSFSVPGDATTLYLGVPDAVDLSGYAGAYSDNGGSYTVTYSMTVTQVPEPNALGVLGFSLIIMAYVFRNKPTRREH